MRFADDQPLPEGMVGHRAGVVLRITSLLPLVPVKNRCRNEKTPYWVRILSGCAGRADLNWYSLTFPGLHLEAK